MSGRGITGVGVGVGSVVGTSVGTTVGFSVGTGVAVGSIVAVAVGVSTGIGVSSEEENTTNKMTPAAMAAITPKITVGKGNRDISPP